MRKAGVWRREVLEKGMRGGTGCSSYIGTGFGCCVGSILGVEFEGGSDFFGTTVFLGTVLSMAS